MPLMQAIIKVVPVEYGPPHPRMWYAVECRVCAYPWVLTVATGFLDGCNDAAVKHFYHRAHAESELRMIARPKVRVYNSSELGHTPIYDVWCGRCGVVVSEYTEMAVAIRVGHIHARDGYHGA